MQSQPNVAAIRASLATVPAPPWRWDSSADSETSLVTAHYDQTDVVLITADAEKTDDQDIYADILFREERDGRTLWAGAQLADDMGRVDNAIARFIERTPAYITALLATLDNVSVVAAELAAEGDLNEVGSDEYVTLHTAAARIRGALGAVGEPRPAPTDTEKPAPTDTSRCEDCGAQTCSVCHVHACCDECAACGGGCRCHCVCPAMRDDA